MEERFCAATFPCAKEAGRCRGVKPLPPAPQAAGVYQNQR